MRALRLAILPFLVATSLAAQTPEPSGAPARPAALVEPRRTAFFDVAALVDGRERFGLEPLVLGRVAIGLIASHTRTSWSPLTPPIAVALPATATGASNLPCAWPGCGPSPGNSYSAWSLDLAVRWYPAALSFNDPRRRLMVYIGEFIGYQWRRLSDAFYGPVPLAQSTICPVVAQPGIALPPGCPPIVPPIVTETQHITGWEPGAEVGVRLRPLEPLFVDVGGWFKLVTIDDPTQRVRPGQLDSRLVAAIGVGW